MHQVDKRQKRYSEMVDHQWYLPGVPYVMYLVVKISQRLILSLSHNLLSQINLKSCGCQPLTDDS